MSSKRKEAEEKYSGVRTFLVLFRAASEFDVGFGLRLGED